eukprot:CAMPEP_0174239842 /NCGR_PEP_ID=MMETSP0417-20130205/16456_1 /TAXON_ID=242541 /ORGANISM="Mayorella sp, Strain BSH-02190019" /LENGTH=76 /DNA_ID=CAMNT_0015318835 /DNA_START=559 /DNA_END=786 /DNA_ORIENTATION=-
MGSSTPVQTRTLKDDGDEAACTESENKAEEEDEEEEGELEEIEGELDGRRDGELDEDTSAAMSGEELSTQCSVVCL